MATLSATVSLAASHGTVAVRESLFVIEATVAGPLVGDFAGGMNDKCLLGRLEEEAGILRGTRLDDVLGRATLENIAAYLVWRLRDIKVTSVTAAVGALRATVSADEVRFDTFEARLFFHRGVSLALRGRMDEAIREFTAAAAVPQLAARALNARGRCKRHGGRPSEALADFEQAMSIEPGFGEAHRNLGNTLLEIGQVTDAVTALSRAIDLMPSSAVAHNNRGFAYQQLGRFDLALADHDRAIELDPSYEEAFRDRANAASRVGRERQAVEDGRKASSLEGSRSALEIERQKLSPPYPKES